MVDEIHVMPKPGKEPTAPPKPKMPPEKEPDQAPKEPKSSKSWMKIVVGLLLVALLAASGYFLYISFRPESEPSPIVNETTEPEQPATSEPAALPSVSPEMASPEAEATQTASPEAVPQAASPDVIGEIVSSRETFEHGEISEFTLDMVSSEDSDEDGLTDDEEALFNTERENMDTDGDTFADGQEVINLYSPKAQETELAGTDLVETFVNENYKYSVMYPAAWFARGTDRSNLEVVFSAENNEFVSIWVEENEGNLPLTEWYQEQAPEVNPDELTEFINKQGNIGLKSPDRFTVYFSRDGYVYIINYNIGLKEEADYPSVYQMMIESFNIITGQRG